MDSISCNGEDVSNEKSSTAKSIGIWEKVIDVQMHFNDLCLRVRNFAVSLLGVLLGAAAISYRFGGLGFNFWYFLSSISSIYL